jgi:glutaminase
MHQAQLQATQGRVVERIPQLAKTHPYWFAVYICCTTGQTDCLGDTACCFPLMSGIKPFLLLYLLEQQGAEQVWQWVGTDPSDQPFNSLNQLIADQGRPRNPMINSGAITLADKLPGHDASDRCQQFCDWLNQLANCHLQLDETMLASVRSTGREPNLTIAHYLAEAGRVGHVETALDTYEQICCLSGQVADLAGLGLQLAQEGTVSSAHRQIVNAMMLTCGLYEASGRYAVQIGLPMKSGISGALLAIVPGQGAIACYSPALDRVGNPVAGLALVEMLSRALQLSLFV